MTPAKSLLFTLAVLLIAGLGFTLGRSQAPTPAASPLPPARPALSVEIIRPESRELPLTLVANGSIAAWQEAIIGAEVGGLRLAELHVQVGDKVRKGQVLAIFDAERVLADVAQGRALLAEAEANLAEARLNADRARKVRGSNALTAAMSAQQADQYLAAERAAEAKRAAAKAQLDLQEWRLRHTRVVAGDYGVISARKATLGAVPAAGEELFRLIRQHRLEWRGELTAAELPQLKPGLAVAVEVAGAGRVMGKVRTLAPTLDAESRNGLVYVDLPDAERAGLRPGMFAKGVFQLGTRPGLSVPQSALVLREGFAYLFRLAETTGELARVAESKVELGRREGDWVEILTGLAPDDRLVAHGGAFLNDGDSVRVVGR